jgi:hypothetical protein
MIELKEFLEHEEESIRKTAEVLQELTETLESGTLSKEEYDELVGDLLDMKKIDELADTIERKAIIEKAFNLMTQMLSSVA